jgi:hypothetical protein
LNCKALNWYNFFPLKNLTMMVQEQIFSNPLSIEELEAKLRASLAGAFSFLIESCCIDTQPQIPSGKA